jgi:hypothetical protein
VCVHRSRTIPFFSVNFTCAGKLTTAIIRNSGTVGTPWILRFVCQNATRSEIVEQRKTRRDHTVREIAFERNDQARMGNMNNRKLSARMLAAGCFALATVAWPVLCNAGAADSKKSPAIQFDQPEFDFGFLLPGKGTTLTHKFTFHNKGSKALEIHSVGQACRTEAKCPVKALRPGGSSYVQITTVLPKEYTNTEEFSRQIRVETNDPAHPFTELTIKARFAFSLKWEPKNIDLGRFVAGQSGDSTITIESLTKDSSRISKCSYNEKILDVRLTTREGSELSSPTITGSGIHRAGTASDTGKNKKTLRKEQALVLIRVKPEAPEGSFFETVTLNTGRSDIPSIKVPVSGCVVRGVDVEPKEVFFGIVRTAQQVDLDVRIASQSSDFQVASIASDVPAVKARFSKEDKGYRIRVTLDPAQINGPFEGALTVHTKSPAKSEIKIPVRGMVKLSPKAQGT